MGFRAKAKSKARIVHDFLEKDLWEANLKELPRLRSWVYHDLRVLHMLASGFIADRCTIRAASLTFSTLLSIVPLLAFVLAIARAFNFQERLEPFILQHVFPQGLEADVHGMLSDFVQKAMAAYTQSTKVTALGGVGLLFLLYAVIRIMSTIENAFNDIWGIKQARSFYRKVTDYLTLLILGPVAVTVIMGINIGTALSSLGIEADESAATIWGQAILVNVAPYLIYWLFLTVLYLFMPNTRVQFKPAAISGFFAGLLFQLVQLFYVKVQLSLTNVSGVYGAFAALPMFLIWLQVSWIVILLGAELCYALQNVSSYREESGPEINEADREAVAVQILTTVCRRFEAGAPPVKASDLAEEHDLPIRQLNELVYQLEIAGLVSCLSQPSGGIALVRSPRSIRVADVLSAVRGVRIERLSPPVDSVMARVEEASAKVGESITMEDVVNLTDGKEKAR